jgi:O-antigen ligase
MAFYFALAYLFVRVSFLHEIAVNQFGIRTYLPWILGAPAILGLLASGGLRRAFRTIPAYFWVAYAAWLIMATPFSFWRAESVTLLTEYFKATFPMLFMIAGLPIDWPECRRMLHTVAAAAVLNVLLWRVFAQVGSGRLALEFGSIANSNDYAAHLLAVVPFLLFVVLTVRPWLLAAPVLAIVFGGIYFCVSTGSRGGLIALIAACTYLFLRAPGRVRIAVIVLVPVLSALTIANAPKYALERQATMFAGSEDSTAKEADPDIASSQRRLYLLKTSLAFTLQHPLFGVGPGEFLNYEGATAVGSGRRGAWQVTHNTYTQVSSEAGIPALVFFLAAILTTYRLLSKTYRTARARKELRPIAMAALCLMVSLVGFGVANLFLSLAHWSYHLLMLSGFAICLASIVDLESASPKLPSASAGVRGRPERFR